MPWPFRYDHALRYNGARRGEPRMKAFITALTIALATVPGLLVLMAAPVNAQFKGMSNDRISKDHANDPNQKKKPDDTGYKSALERLPDKKFDPWANMR
jgi:hypothetical protein